MVALLRKHWNRLKRSLGRRYREWRLPAGYVRLGTRYGGWWVDRSLIASAPLLVDCGLGRDISFPVAFLNRFGGAVIGIDPNPASVEYCKSVKPPGMDIWPYAFWRSSGEILTFHLPRPVQELPKGADGISGSLLPSHEYAGTERLDVRTTSLEEVLRTAGRETCDVLKLDIEGAEYEVLDSLCESGLIRKTRQVLIEFHHHCTDHPLEHTLNAVARLERSGFELAHTEGRNYIFREAAVA